MKLFILSFFILTISSAFATEKFKSIDLQVTENGFEPSTIKVEAGTDLELKITRKTDSTCAREILIPSKNIKKDLPLNKMINLKIGKLEKGKVSFACGMDMVSGVIIID
jgi:plastocyanin domain-containing protein